MVVQAWDQKMLQALLDCHSDPWGRSTAERNIPTLSCELLGSGKA